MKDLFGKKAKVKARVTAAKRNEVSTSFEHISKGWLVFPGSLFISLNFCLHFVFWLKQNYFIHNYILMYYLEISFKRK